MIEALGLDTLFAEMIFAIGLAIILGNGYAYYRHRRGERPDDAEEGAEFNTGRVLFLSVVGALMATWGGISVFG
ncbi:MAG TPA: hypothetical protein VIW46_14915 [Acidimicrobiia bacterium]|jgi:hypothetical protein